MRLVFARLGIQRHLRLNEGTQQTIIGRAKDQPQRRELLSIQGRHLFGRPLCISVHHSTAICWASASASGCESDPNEIELVRLLVQGSLQ